MDYKYHCIQIPISCKYDSAHVAMTYTALLSLLILGDGLQQVNRAAVVKAVRNLQCEDGRYTQVCMPLYCICV